MSICELKNKEVTCWCCQKVNIKQSELQIKEEDYINLVKQIKDKNLVKSSMVKNEERILKLEMEKSNLMNKILDLENELKTVRDLNKLSIKKSDLDLAGAYKDR